jgi:hypothetical protein
MAIRSFVDSRGTGWRVWVTIPPVASLVNPYRTGWLTFVSLTDRRKLTPVPKDWASASETQLEEWCSMADRMR